MLDLSGLDFDKNGGVVTVVTQDAASGMVLMVAQLDREALQRTLSTGEMHYFSEARGAWHKGTSNGNTQRVVSLAADCDGDVLLARVVPKGPACHTGSLSCFVGPEGMSDALLGARCQHRRARRERRGRPLRRRRNDRVAGELYRAAARGPQPSAAQARRGSARTHLRVRRRRSSAGHRRSRRPLYHALVALRAAGGSLSDVQRVLARRATPAVAARPIKREPSIKDRKK